MKTLKTYAALLAVIAITTAASCTNKNNDVKPVKAFSHDMSHAMPQDSSGGEDDPTRPPHH